MASQPLPRTLQPPPDLPNDPETSNTLSQYLRTFSLWARHGFADKLSVTTATPGILLQATDAATGNPTPFSYLIGVKVTVTGGVPSAPTLTFTAQLLGSGRP